MEFWIEQFFGDSYGLSVTIGFLIMFGIGGWLFTFFIRKMKESEAAGEDKMDKSQQ